MSVPSKMNDMDVQVIWDVFNHKNKDEQHEETQRCKCDSERIEIDGFYTCTECGDVGSCAISDEAEWQTDSNGSSYLATNPTTDTDLYSAKWGVGTVVSVKWNNTASQRRIAKVSLYNSMNHRDRALHHAYKDFDSVQDILGLVPNITRAAKILYKKFNEKKLTRGAVRTGIKANCIFFACKEHNSPKTAQEICNALAIPTKDMSRTVNIFKDVLLNDTQENAVIITSKDVVMQHLAHLGIYDGRFKMKCMRLCEELKTCVELMGKTPKGVAAAVIYTLLNGTRTKQEICDACSISVPTLNKLVLIIESKIKD